ncbi:MAG: sensor histidine kinase [Eubacteriales bacterium]|nr:sensor histidine kinase [Eubacteriales bacterium]
MKHAFTKMMGRLRIRNKLIFTILPCVLIGFAAIVLIFISVFRCQIKPMLSQQAEANIQASMNNLKTRIKTITTQSDALLYDADNGIRDAIKELSPDMPASRYEEAYSLIRGALNDFSPFEGDTYNSMIRRAFIRTWRGEVITRDSFYASTRDKISQIADAVEQPANVLHGKVYLYADPASPNVLYLARTIYEWQGTVSFSKLDTPIGLWVLEIQLRAFSQLIEGKLNPVIQYALARGDEQMIFSSVDLQADLCALQSGDRLADGEATYRVYAYPLGLNDLRLLALVNETLLYSDITGTFQQWILAIGLCLTLVLAAIIMASASLSRQFDAFIAKIGSTQLADHNALLPVSTQDEFGELARVYNEMMLRISSLHEQVVMNELMVKKAELRSFQAQINPHFLYNTLDCINSLVAMGRMEETRQTVTALGNIMRMSIKGPDFLSVAQEVDYIRQYLLIQKMRYQDRILFLLEVPNTLAHDRIPKLVLQPILENAIIHGVSEKIGQGVVAIRGREENGTLIFEIRDNGVGMPESIIQRINERREEAPEEMARGSIGILNIQSRLFLLYGERYGLRISANPKGGTCVTVRLPREPMEETP